MKRKFMLLLVLALVVSMIVVPAGAKPSGTVNVGPDISASSAR